MDYISSIQVVNQISSYLIYFILFIFFNIQVELNYSNLLLLMSSNPWLKAMAEIEEREVKKES